MTRNAPGSKPRGADESISPSSLPVIVPQRPIARNDHRGSD
jgi:hypothetical protein